MIPSLSQAVDRLEKALVDGHHAAIVRGEAMLDLEIPAGAFERKQVGAWSRKPLVQRTADTEPT